MNQTLFNPDGSLTIPKSCLSDFNLAFLLALEIVKLDNPEWFGGEG